MGNLMDFVQSLPATFAAHFEASPSAFLDALLRRTQYTTFGSGLSAWFGKLLLLLTIAFLAWPYSHIVAAAYRDFRNLSQDTKASKTRLRRSGPRLHRAPATRVIALAEFWFSAKTREILVQPLLDMRVEHFEALAAGRHWLARVVLVRGYASFLNTLCLYLFLNVGKKAASIWRLLL